MFQPVIKWTGSKRPLSKEIISYFPKQIDTYYEPFVGGGSVLRTVLESKITVKDFVVGDVCEPLILLWQKIKDNPQELITRYEYHWNKCNGNPEYFYYVRSLFNKDKSDVGSFLFLTRTSTNGLIRFNNKGNYNASFHLKRKGIIPETLSKIIFEWSGLIQKVQFYCQDYQNISPTVNDFAFLDPPYYRTKGQFYGTIEYSYFFKFLQRVPVFALTFDGKRNEEMQYELDTTLYDKHVFLSSQQNSFQKMRKKKILVNESLYLKGI